jgi:Arc/MetJ-type ribon-helix-helix transcriptional regulator
MPNSIRANALPPSTRRGMAPPLSVSITPDQLAWIDQRRAHGSLSRSAVIRQALDGLMQRDTAADAL